MKPDDFLTDEEKIKRFLFSNDIESKFGELISFEEMSCHCQKEWKTEKKDKIGNYIKCENLVQVQDRIDSVMDYWYIERNETIPKEMFDEERKIEKCIVEEEKVDWC